MSELWSTSYLDDYKIIDYCSSYYGLRDMRCDCVNKKISRQSEKTILLPYECVSLECLDPNRFKTHLIAVNQEKCNQNRCQVTIEGLTLKGDTSVVIRNDCVTSNYDNIVDTIFIEAPLTKTYNPKTFGFDYLLPSILLSFMFLII